MAALGPCWARGVLRRWEPLPQAGWDVETSGSRGAHLGVTPGMEQAWVKHTVSLKSQLPPCLGGTK